MSNLKNMKENPAWLEAQGRLRAMTEGVKVAEENLDGWRTDRLDVACEMTKEWPTLWVADAAGISYTTLYKALIEKGIHVPEKSGPSGPGKRGRPRKNG